MEVFRFTQVEEWVEAMANDFKQHAFTGMNIGLAGGHAPKPLYKKLSEDCQEMLSSSELWLLDERVVPLDDLDSNYYMITESGLSDDAEAFHFVNTELDRQEMVENYNNEFKALPDKSLDIAIIGIGEFAHVASIFPHSEAISSDKAVVSALVENQDVSERVTVTLDILKRAKHTIVVAKGKEDEDVLEMIESDFEEEDISKFPALYLADLESVSFFLL